MEAPVRTWICFTERQLGTRDTGAKHAPAPLDILVYERSITVCLGNLLEPLALEIHLFTQASVIKNRQHEEG